MAKQETKPWYESKIIWTGIVITLGGIFAFLETRYPSIGIFGTVSGIMVVILRTLSPGTPIK